MPPREPIPPAVVAGAAATLAAVPGASVPLVAEALGETHSRLRSALKKDPTVSTDPIRHQSAKAAEVTARAHEAVSRAQTELSGPELPSVGAVAERVAGTMAVDVATKVLTRHRKEWDVPRGLLGEAVQARTSMGTQEAFERAKLAKIAAETLTLVQMGECRAYGIKSGDVGPVIEVERDE